MNPKPLVLATALAIALVGPTSEAVSRPLRNTPQSPTSVDSLLLKVQQAIEEQRYVDASHLLANAKMDGVTDPRLPLASGNLNLAQGRFSNALEAFRLAQRTPLLRAESLEGQGLALMALEQHQEAEPLLEQAVAANAQAWRAWNALGTIYDRRGDWQRSNLAYDQALVPSNGSAILLNNRGYSRLLQGQRAQAISDFIAALAKEPAMTVARRNLRLAMALEGDYDRALAGGTPLEQSTLLNNAGFAAAVRGDYQKANELLNKALSVRATYYERAAENLKLVSNLSTDQRIRPDGQH